MVLSAVNGYGCFWLSSAGGLLLRELYVDAELPVITTVALCGYIWAPIIITLALVAYFTVRLRSPDIGWLLWSPSLISVGL